MVGCMLTKRHDPLIPALILCLMMSLSPALGAAALLGCICGRLLY
jgi:hypothetical protein